MFFWVCVILVLSEFVLKGAADGPTEIETIIMNDEVEFNKDDGALKVIVQEIEEPPGDNEFCEEHQPDNVIEVSSSYVESHFIEFVQKIRKCKISDCYYKSDAHFDFVQFI